MLYELKCNKCGKCYYGETSCSIYERNREHKEGEKNEDQKNALWKHDMNDHGGETQTYSTSIVGRERKPMKRQIREKLIIEEEIKKQGSLMNSKNEWGGAPLPRIGINKVEEDKEGKEEREEGGKKIKERKRKTARGKGEKVRIE